MIEFLMDRARDFRKKINLETIEIQLQSDEREDRCDSTLFTVYHLLVSGAVAEEGIDLHLKDGGLPERVRSRTDDWDWPATERAWKGTAFGNERNLLGTLAFLVVLLFLFEGFCKMVVGESKIRDDLDRPRGLLGLSAVVDWLCEFTEIDREKLSSIAFLNAYRNAWHSFGRYSGRTITAKGMWLEEGERIPVVGREKHREFLGDLLDVFLEVDDMRDDRRCT